MVRLLEKTEVIPVVTEVMSRAIGDDRIQDPVNIEYASRSFAKGGLVFAHFDTTGTPRGILVGLITPDILTGILTGYEYLWLCEKSARGIGAINLLVTFERYCKDHGCKNLVIGSHAMVQQERRMRLYEKLDYKPHTQSFVRVL